MSLRDDLEAAIAQQEGMIGDLHQAAQELQSRYSKDLYARNKGRPFTEQSGLWLLVRLRGNSLSLIWQETKWVGTKAKGTRQAFHENIRKPEGSHSYNMTRLMKVGQPWQADMISEIEAQLTRIRQETTFICKSLRYLRETLKVEEERMAAEEYCEHD